MILTLDAGGTNLVFSAVKDGELAGKPITAATPPDDLDLFLKALVSGFNEVSDQFDEHANAISFAFPGPADYESGVIGDLQNLPAFNGNVALGPYLEHHFNIPVFINNDGDMFALGEARAGYLPWINTQLRNAGSQRQYKNLVSVTLGTGFGAGVVVDGKILKGDTGTASEAWLFRNKVFSYTNVEDILSIRAVRRMYAEQIHMDPAKAPYPDEIYRIATDKEEGSREAAVETWYRYGEILGDSLAHINAIVDGVIVIGGGLSGAYPVFSKSMFDELNGFFNSLSGKRFSRSVQKYYNTEKEYFFKKFLKPVQGTATIPGSNREVTYLKEKKIPVGLSRLGSSEGISLGCYYYALEKLSHSL
ncbi:ROK family protein [Balneola sp. MJW-20]|uniref:ROK family protein n=1 Tax=Gracilimonas aurantiaca TaxID=3234185 RepID=UPI00346773FB